MEPHDTGGSTLLQPLDQRVALPNAEPAEIEYLKLGPAPRVKSRNALQGLQIVIKGRTDKYPDLEVIAAVRLLPIVKSMNELLEPGKR
jgi:hypothetical protein